MAKIENTDKIIEVKREIDQVTREIRAVSDRTTHPLKNVEFNKGGPNVNLHFYDKQLLCSIETVTIKFLELKREKPHELMETL